MAEAKKADSGDGEQPASKKKSKLLLIIAVAAVLALAIGGGVIYLLASKKAAHSEDEGDQAPPKEAKVDKAAAEAPPVFVKLEAFTVKLQTESQDAYLQVVPELRVLNAHIGDKIKDYMPEIRHKVLLILAGKKASDLSSPQGVQQLSNEMRVTINGVIDQSPQRRKGKAATEPGDLAAPDDPVQEVLFTSFIVQ
jgi:flagellar protein FliL